MRFTPTYSSWLNQVVRRFGHISEKAIKKSSFCSAKELMSKMEEFTHNCNKSARPFVRTATPESILKKGRIYLQAHSRDGPLDHPL